MSLKDEMLHLALSNIVQIDVSTSRSKHRQIT